MSTPPLVAPHQPGDRTAATTMASGAPPAPIAIAAASEQAVANRDLKPKSQTQFDFDLLPFRIDCSFPGCQAKLDGKRDVFCLMHMQSLSGSKSRSSLAEPSPSPIAAVVPAVVGAAARPLPHPQPQPQPSLSPAPDLASISPQLQLPTLKPGKMMPENEYRRHIFPLRKTATNTPRIVAQQPTPKHTTPPLVGEVPAAMMSSTSTATATAATGPPVAATPLPVVHSPPISPSPSQNGEPARKRVKLTDSLGGSPGSRLNEQTTASRMPASAPTGAPKPLITTWSSGKGHSLLKPSEEKNKPAPVPRLSNRQPIRKMALPSTINFIVKPPRQPPSGPPPELPGTISSRDFAANPQKNDNNSTTFNNSLNHTSQSTTNGFHPQSDRILLNNQRLQGLSSSQFYGGQPATDRRSQVNGQPQANGQPQTSGLNVIGSFRAKDLHQTSAQQANQKPQVNGDRVPPKHEPQTNGGQSKEHIPLAINSQSRMIAVGDLKILDSRESRAAELHGRANLTARPRVQSPVRTVNNRPSPPSAPSEAPPKKAKIVIKFPELSDFDMLIYSQPDARPPPPGYSQPKPKPKPPVRVPTPPPQIQTQIEEDQFDDALFTPPPPPPPPKDEPLYANIDPRIHWPQHHSAEWHAKKQVEIQARGGRKANFGRAAQRMREQKQVQPVPSAEEFEASLPEKIAGNLAWVRALKRLNGIAVDEEPICLASTASGTATGANGLNGGGGGGVSGLLEKRVRGKLKRTGSGVSWNGNGNANGGDF